MGQATDASNPKIDKMKASVWHLIYSRPIGKEQGQESKGKDELHSLAKNDRSTKANIKNIIFLIEKNAHVCVLR